MIGVRANTFNDNIGEPEQDANSALTELDKGLRSVKVGEQCEAIVRFPRLFEKYPFPILINSSFLKLADVFRMGNNFLRLWVLRVCQQSEKHLDKIVNIDEFLRRIFSVLHSNDPVARALTLRTLGAVAGIIPERQNVHHAIRRGLDSQDSVEVDAAIYATTRFAAHSNAFAVAMCNKISDMVESESTDAERRVKLVKALRTVHGGAVRAHGVLKLLHTLLERFPSSSSVRASIVAVTAIAADTVVHVPDQVDLLLNLATNDPRASVRRTALIGLKKLAHHAGIWPMDCIRKLVKTASDTQDMEHIMLCLQVMEILVQCGAVCAEAASPRGSGAGLREYCRRAAMSSALQHAATALATLTTLSLYCSHEGQIDPHSADLMLALETLVVATGANDNPQNIRPLRIALKYMVQLSSASPDIYSTRTVQVVSSQLQFCSWSKSGRRLTSLLEALAAIGGGTHTAAQSPLKPVVNVMLKALEDAEEVMKTDYPPESGTALVLTCCVMMQERAAANLHNGGDSGNMNSGWQAKALSVVEKADGWTRYRVAITALRYGHCRVAAVILKRLSMEAPSESAQRWLVALCRAADADATLMEEGPEGLGACWSAWLVAGGRGGLGASARCASACGACALCSAPSLALPELRARSLQVLRDVALAANCLCSQPPPQIAQCLTGAPACGRCYWALKKVAEAARGTSQAARKVASSAFSADDSTLNHLRIIQHTYTLLAQFLDRVTSSQQDVPPELFSREIKPRNLEEMIALAPCVKLQKISNALFDDLTTGPGITHKHRAAVLAVVRALSPGAGWAGGALLAGAGAGGAGACRMSLSPSDATQTLPVDHHLALTLDAHICPQPLRKRQKPRQVKAVQLTFTATPHPRTNEKSVELALIPPVLRAVQTVTPMRDFFSAQQLISVPAPGLYAVAVDAAFVDEAGRLWHTGPKISIVVKAHEESSGKGNAQNPRNRF